MICFSVWRGGLYHINQQLSELLSCILLDNELHEFAIELDALEG